jgi:nitrate reductase NapE component
MLIKENRTKRIEQREKKVRLTITLFILLASCFFPLVSLAQCAMCRAALESNENTVQAEAVNDGIVFLMVIPYILVALVGFAVYKLKYSKK